MGLCDVPVISNVCDTAGEAAASLISAPFDWLAQAMGAAAGWLFEAVWAVFDTTTLVDVTSDEYLGVYNIVFGIAVFVMLLFFCLQLITGLIRPTEGRVFFDDADVTRLPMYKRARAGEGDIDFIL